MHVPPPDPPSVAERTVRKCSKRILPFLFALYVISYIDRANVSFAKLPMSADLHLSESVFGFAAGVFFIGYLLLEIPGAVMVQRWSARLWFSRILITWGICTLITGFVHTRMQFYFARFLLGLSEAGFFPGIIVYLTHWFPQAERARAMAGFIIAVPVSFLVGAPLSAACLSMHWFSLAGWRWLFILQGLPALAAGIITPFYLCDHPIDARWLKSSERNWLAQELAREKLVSPDDGRAVLLLPHLRLILQLALTLFVIVLATYGFVFWLRCRGFAMGVDARFLGVADIGAGRICGCNSDWLD